MILAVKKIGDRKPKGSSIFCDYDKNTAFCGCRFGISSEEKLASHSIPEET